MSEARRLSWVCAAGMAKSQVLRLSLICILYIVRVSYTALFPSMGYVFDKFVGLLENGVIVNRKCPKVDAFSVSTFWDS